VLLPEEELLPGLVITTLFPEEELPDVLPVEELPVEELLPAPDVSSPGFAPTITVSVRSGASFLLMDADGDLSSTVTELPEELPVLPDVLPEDGLTVDDPLPAVIVLLFDEDDTPGPPLTVPDEIVPELPEPELVELVPVLPDPFVITAFSRKVPLIISCRPSFV
jgi:hypothetical protein